MIFKKRNVEFSMLKKYIGAILNERSNDASSIHDNCFGKVIFRVSVFRYFECNDQHCNYIVKLRENGVSFHKLMIQNISAQFF